MADTVGPAHDPAARARVQMPEPAAPRACGEQGKDQAMYDMKQQAALYDLFYMSMEDYSAEAGQIADLIRRARPHCRTLLDVGCGTGEHARLLGEVHGFEVDGVDLDPAMLAIARTKWLHGRFDVADMTDFLLGRSYD